MNEEYLNNENPNTSESQFNHNEEITEPEAPAGQEPAPGISQPYRYKYENGEKREMPNEPAQASQQTAYDTYNYNAAYGYNTNSYNTGSYTTGTTHTTVEVTPKKKKHPFLKAIKWVAGAACFGILAGAAFMGTTYFATEVLGIELVQIQSASNDTSTSGSSNTATGTGTPVNITIGTTSTIEGAESPAESVVVQVVEQNMAATVAVKSTFLQTYSYWGQTYQQETQGSGSGFIVGINETELLIATNNHVIDSATKIEVTFIDDTVLEATIKGTDSIADLAIIAVPLENITEETLGSIRVATLGDSDEVRLGEMAIAIGNALGYGQSVTVGYISAKDRTVTVDGNDMVLLQTDAAINGGNSGGPLFNTKGEVIGINSVKYADEEVEGMCFAIPISRAIPILNELMNRETLAEEDKGFLGVSTRSVTDEIASFYSWPIGAYIVSVLEGSPAEEANLYVGDIVTKVNGVQIITADQLVSAVSSYRYGTTIELTVQRNVNGKYEEITLNVTLAKKADVEAANSTITEGSTIQPEDSSNSSDSSGNSGNSGNSGSSGGSKRPGSGR